MRGLKRPAVRGLVAAAAATGLVLGVAACGGSDDSGDSGDGGGDGASADVKKGGTYRVEQTDFGFTDAFDPTGEYLGAAWSTYSNLLTRTLLSTNHVAGPEGNVIAPDLATDMPTVSNGGKTYTFTLKKGIRFGPPVSREITSQDFVTSFERIATPDLAAGYANYYDKLEGWDAFADGTADSIAGIKTPDDKTISFTFTQKFGDVADRMTMPATGPIPQEVSKCFTQAGEYGRYVISSGPYMIKGSPQLNVQSCATMKPISGFNPNRFLNFVRNPDYDAATDTTEMRENNVDAVNFTINTNLDDIYDRIDQGQVDGSADAPPLPVLRRYSRDEGLKERLHVESGDRTWYIFMNLTQPPFDDIHIRKAANLVMDKDGLQRAWGGPTAGKIATKTVPDSLYNNQFTSADYNPYPSEGNTGDVEAAKAEIRQSKYDTDRNGICDEAACKGVFMINRNFGPWASMQPVIEQSLEKIGITLDARELPLGPAYNTTQTVSRKVPIGANHGWGKDYADSSTFAVLQDGRNIIPTNNSNVSLTGLKPAQAQELGVDYPQGGVPNVDADVDKCLPLTGDERNQCYIALDKKVMEQVVPWVPYLDASVLRINSEAVTKWGFDQFATEVAYSKVAVDPSKQR